MFEIIATDVSDTHVQAQFNSQASNAAEVAELFSELYIVAQDADCDGYEDAPRSVLAALHALIPVLDVGKRGKPHNFRTEGDRVIYDVMRRGRTWLLHVDETRSVDRSGNDVLLTEARLRLRADELAARAFEENTRHSATPLDIQNAAIAAVDYARAFNGDAPSAAMAEDMALAWATYVVNRYTLRRRFLGNATQVVCAVVAKFGLSAYEDDRKAWETFASRVVASTAAHINDTHEAVFGGASWL